jgi:hypothetical protein
VPSVVTPKKLRLEEAVKQSAAALRRLAEYKLERPIQDRLTALSENKEFLTKLERRELKGLVDFWQRRTLEVLEARLALKRLADVFPDLVPDP